MSKRESTQSMCVDLMKLLRHQAMTNADVQRATGWHVNTVTKWLHEFEDQGLVLTSKTRREGVSGPPLTLYQLSPEWRGKPNARPVSAGDSAFGAL